MFFYLKIIQFLRKYHNDLFKSWLIKRCHVSILEHLTQNSLSLKVTDQFLDSVFNGALSTFIVPCFYTGSTLYIPSCSIVHPLKFVNATFCFVVNNTALEIQLEISYEQRELIKIKAILKVKFLTKAPFVSCTLLVSLKYCWNIFWGLHHLIWSRYFKARVATPRNYRDVLISFVRHDKNYCAQVMFCFNGGRTGKRNWIRDFPDIITENKTKSTTSFDKYANIIEFQRLKICTSVKFRGR